MICEIECVLNPSLGFTITRVDIHGQGGTIKPVFFWYIQETTEKPDSF